MLKFGHGPGFLLRKAMEELLARLGVAFKPGAEQYQLVEHTKYMMAPEPPAESMHAHLIVHSHLVS